MCVSVWVWVFSLSVSLIPLHAPSFGLPLHSKQTSCHRQPNCCVLFGKFVLDYNTLRGRKLVPAVAAATTAAHRMHYYYVMVFPFTQTELEFVFVLMRWCIDALRTSITIGWFMFKSARGILIQSRNRNTFTDSVVIACVGQAKNVTKIALNRWNRNTTKRTLIVPLVGQCKQRVRSKFEWKSKTAKEKRENSI